MLRRFRCVQIFLETTSNSLFEHRLHVAEFLDIYREKLEHTLTLQTRGPSEHMDMFKWILYYSNILLLQKIRMTLFLPCGNISSVCDLLHINDFFC